MDKSVTTEKPVVKVYVRLGSNENEREISLPSPYKWPPSPKLGETEIVDELDLLELGFAIDGTDAVLAVTPYTFVFTEKQGDFSDWRLAPEWFAVNEWHFAQDEPEAENARPLPVVLAEVEKAIIGWLASLGYKAEFA